MASGVTAPGFVLQPNYVNPDLARDVSYKTMFPTAAPKDLVYNDVLMTPAGKREWVETPAENGNVFGPSNSKMVFNVRSTNILDFRQHVFEFKAQCEASDGSLVYFTNGIWNLISRIRILLGNDVLMELREKNVFESMMYTFSRAPNYDNTLGYSLEGVGTTTNRKAWATGHTYAIPLSAPFLTSEQQVMMNNQGYTIEIYLAPAESVVCYDALTVAGSRVNYTVRDAKLRYHEITYQDDLYRPLQSLSPITYCWTGYDVFHGQIQQGQTNFQFPIPVKVQGIDRIIAIMRDADDVDNPEVADVLTTRFNYNNCRTVQLKVNNRMVPGQPISAGGDKGPLHAYLEAVQCFDRWETGDLEFHRREVNGTSAMRTYNNIQFDIDDFTTNRFAACVDLRITPDNDPTYIPSFDSTPGNVQLIFNMTFNTGSPTKNQILYLFVIHTGVTMMDDKGNANLIE